MTVGLALTLLGFVIGASFSLILAGTFDGSTPRWAAGLYFALKGHTTLIGAIVGFRGLAWSLFYQAARSRLRP